MTASELESEDYKSILNIRTLQFHFVQWEIVNETTQIFTLNRNLACTQEEEMALGLWFGGVRMGGGVFGGVGFGGGGLGVWALVGCGLRGGGFGGKK